MVEAVRGADGLEAATLAMGKEDSGKVVVAGAADLAAQGEVRYPLGLPTRSIKDWRAAASLKRISLVAKGPRVRQGPKLSGKRTPAHKLRRSFLLAVAWLRLRIHSSCKARWAKASLAAGPTSGPRFGPPGGGPEDSGRKGLTPGSTFRIWFGTGASRRLLGRRTRKAV